MNKVHDNGSASEILVGRPASKLFWAAIAKARWYGVAYVDFENLILGYWMRSPKNDLSHFVTMDLIQRGSRRTLLVIRAVRLPRRSEKFIAERDTRLERNLVSQTIEASGWSRLEWKSIDLTFPGLSGDCEIEIGIPKGTGVRMNGIVLPVSDQVARAVTSPGYAVAELHWDEKVDTNIEARGFFHTSVGKNLPNMVTLVAALAPPTLRPPVAPPIPAGTGAATGAAGGLLSRVCLWTAAAWGAYQTGKAIKTTVEIYITREDNEEQASSCCCVWERRDVIQLPVFDPNGRIVIGVAVYRRTFARTVPMPLAGPCFCGAPPLFPPIQVTGEGQFQGLTLQLPGGPPNGQLRSFPRISCPVPGFSPARLVESFQITGRP